MATDLDLISQTWESDVLPTLSNYVRIAALSPTFDPDWSAHGHIGEAVALLLGWAETRRIHGMTIEVIDRDGLTPVILIEVPATGGQLGGQDTVLLYGHLDKQPEMTGWRAGLSPWEPVREGDRLYGRGGADDGYAIFAALGALEALQREGGSHARCAVLIEASEESGSPHLAAHVAALGERLGQPSLVICLDSGCGDYDRLWATTSLRGLVSGVLSVQMTTEGLHSGSYGGIIPSTFRIARRLLDRIEDVATGKMQLVDLYAEVPLERVRQAETAASILGDTSGDLALVRGADVRDGRTPGVIVLDNTWQPCLEVIGSAGLPPLAQAGNVLRPLTELALSVRLPPSVDATTAAAAIRTALEADPPYGALVQFTVKDAASGWNAPATAPWLASACNDASVAHFGQPFAATGEGGTIPFMGMLGARFPEAQFLVIGVLGPGSNAHGPNEFLHIPMAKKLTACVADILAAHFRR